MLLKWWIINFGISSKFISINFHSTDILTWVELPINFSQITIKMTIILCITRFWLNVFYKQLYLCIFCLSIDQNYVDNNSNKMEISFLFSIMVHLHRDLNDERIHLDIPIQRNCISIVDLIVFLTDYVSKYA